jgi:hypothetical protein
VSLDGLLDQLRVLIDADRLEEAEGLLRQTLTSGTGPLALFAALVKVLRLQCRPDEALPIQRMLVDLSPGDLSQRFDLSEIELLSGDFANGWRNYRYRYSLAHTTLLARKVQRPRWDGQRIEGRTLLIHDEQGFGDTLQFLRLVPQAVQRSGAHVVFQVMPELLGLAQRAGLGAAGIIPSGALPPAFDLHCELMSLPMALGLRLEDLPGPIPYLQPDPERLARWHQRLAALPRPLVALNWAGRPTHFNDAARSVSFATLAPLAGAGVTFLAIQKGPAAAQAEAAPPGMRIERLDNEIADFDDTAAILSIADLLISVDSSPVHLTGALGRAAWVMLPHAPDWRWLTQRTDTPWYPTHRLFRQHRRHRWDEVVADLSAALAKL